MNAWSIQQELQSATGETDLDMALQSLGILEDSEHSYEIVIHHGWERGGSETHIFTFSVKSDIGRVIPLILKAYTPSFALRPLAESLDEIMARRRMLASCGINTPKIYFRQKAIWLEHLIPYELGSRIGMLAQDQEKLFRLMMQLHMWAIALDELGFSAIDPFSDLRTDDENVYAIDFGTDLGSPSVKCTRHAYDRMLLEWLVKLGIRPDHGLLAQSHAQALALLSERFSCALSHFGKELG